MKEKIGEGSFGKVYRAIHKKSGAERAVKVLKIKLMK
jgi:serine/threonine protein kinase